MSRQNRLPRQILTKSTSVWRLSLCVFAVGLGILQAHWRDANLLAQESTEPSADPTQEQKLVSGIRQLTLDGRRSGEGYFSADGGKLVFQSERSAENPFYQIYLLDFETGDVERVSPGLGKTTCAWVHPDGNQVLFASTHLDPKALDKQREELEMRASGQERRYAWDYDPQFELFLRDAQGELQRLTNAEGYDAEAAISPDGKKIVLASNRAIFARERSREEEELLQRDPSYFIDLYLMNIDGTEIERLTNSVGYDGGPFFSADGRSICWRRFAENGATAEIMTMDLETRQEKQLTKMNAMSWAPFFHPSGQYLVFATNVHGFANFELYLVAADGQSSPVRVTHTDGFDGLATFTPDGRKLSWTSNRNAKKQSQIYLGDWNHEHALQLLGLDAKAKPADSVVPSAELDQVASEAKAVYATLEQSVTPQDVLRHVDFLCRPALGGRGTGTAGEWLATAYVASMFDQLGLEPAGDNGTWYQEFQFTAGVELGANNRLIQGERTWELNQDWRPVAFSAAGTVEPTSVVFAGYGMAAPKTANSEEYDSYVHLDVTDKWVLVFRFMPEDISPQRRQELALYQSLHRKAALARDKGARGLIVVSGPRSQVRNQLVPLDETGALQGSSLPIISVSDELAAQWLSTINRDLGKLQESLDQGKLMVGLPMPDVVLESSIDVQKIRKTGRNVIGKLRATHQSESDSPLQQAIVVGAHIDHLGKGRARGSLDTNATQEVIHFGADDNASGVAVLLEMAQALAGDMKSGKLKTKRDLVFAAWSGEELGLIGSGHFVDQLLKQQATTGSNSNSNVPTGSDATKNLDPTTAAATTATSLYPMISANLNLDMVGRLRDNLVLQGLGSSPTWKSEIEKRNVPVGLSLVLQDDCDLPTDASVFYRRGVPILAAFTGSHEDYHKPTDTPEKLNLEGAAQIGRLMTLISRGLANADEPIPFQLYQGAQTEGQRRVNMRAYLGTVPEYGADDVKGVLLSSVTKNSPADKAGLQGGDVIVELSGKPIDNVYDYTYGIEALKVGQQTSISVLREGKRLQLNIIPGSRE
ncbi:MAG: M28 family peptidase [Planctomycetaceae bacterium]|nr:M28 family peptidase [Planctomycetaceae bacterium]